MLNFFKNKVDVESSLTKSVLPEEMKVSFCEKIKVFLKKGIEKFKEASVQIKILYAGIIGLLLVFLNDLISLTVTIVGVGLLIFAIILILKNSKNKEKGS